MTERRVTTTQRTVNEPSIPMAPPAQHTQVYVQRSKPVDFVTEESETVIREESKVHEVAPPTNSNTIQHTYTEVSTRPAEQVVVEEAPVYRRDGLITASRLIWLLAGFLEALIALRVALKLIAANPNAGFAQLVYGVTEPFLRPFAGLTATPAAGGAVLEIPSIIAIIVYALLASGLVKLLWVLFDRPATVR